MAALRDLFPYVEPEVLVHPLILAKGLMQRISSSQKRQPPPRSPSMPFARKSPGLANPDASVLRINRLERRSR